MLLLPALNQMIDIATTRASAMENHPPEALFFLLAGLSLVSSLLVGYVMSGSRVRSWPYILIVAATMSLIFEPYAAHLANRLASRSVTRVLEIAAGTGVATRSLASVLPDNVAIVATDLNQPMLDQAAATGTRCPVEWRQAAYLSGG